MFSGGVGSWYAAKRTIDQGHRVHLLFADTRMEDEDLYRFLLDAEQDLGIPIERVADGRTPWQVFFDVRYLGNTRADPCSRILKRDLLKRIVHERWSPEDATIVIGIDWTEEHRLTAVQSHWAPYAVEAPLCSPPLIAKHEIFDELKRRGIALPRLYRMRFPHNNCGGFCIKAGQTQFAKLLHEMPKRFKEHEDQEERLRSFLGKDVAILRDRRGGETLPMTLKMLREKIEAGEETPRFDWGGCGCF